MTFLVPLTLYGWIPVVLILFLLMPPRRAVIAAFLVAWLFLPSGIEFKIKALPDYTKMSATVVGVLLAASIFDPDRLLKFRPRWVDIPAAIFCLSHFITSVLNQIDGSGFYDGMSTALTYTVAWGLPYLIGRAYFDDLEGMRDLAVAIFVGGLIYMPLCWIEMRLSPQLHVWLYGYHQHSFLQNIRWGGYRPMVFMQHGLMVGMWMCMTALIGVWLWKSGTVRAIWDIPMLVLVPLLLITAILCRSTYAGFLLAGGTAALLVCAAFRVKWIVVCLVIAPILFMALRGSGLVEGRRIIATAKETFGEERGGSLQTRIEAENLLAAKARQRLFFGWGGWGRNRTTNEFGQDAITDSQWIITFGTAGLVNLAALTLLLLLPMILIIRDYRVELWSHPFVAPAVVLAMISMLYMYDHLMNAMVNPIFMLAVGAVCGAHYNLPKRLPIPPWWNVQPQQPQMPHPGIRAASPAGR